MQFGWTDQVENAFIELKQSMISTLTLAMPNFNEPFGIETDASGDGIGAILTQQKKPIAYMNRTLRVSKQSCSINAKEMLTIV